MKLVSSVHIRFLFILYNMLFSTLTFDSTSSGLESKLICQYYVEIIASLKKLFFLKKKVYPFFDINELIITK